MMYDQANAFSDCANKCFEKEEDTLKIVEYSKVGIVNSAFACELYLKALLKYYKVTIKKEHKLKDLFDKLPEDNQRNINNKVLKLYGRLNDIWGFSLLEQVSNAFIDWRYCYEKDRLRCETGFLLAFRDSLREECKTVFIV